MNCLNLLNTKLSNPRKREGIVERNRLLDSLENGRWKKTSLITGPPGSGKSTLLAQWSSKTTVKVAWFSLDETDNDPKFFLTYLFEALHRVIPEIVGNGDEGTDLYETLGFKRILESRMLTPLGNYTKDFILMMDDLHVIRDENIFEMIKLLIRYMPSNMHLALTSRAEPPIGLSGLRVKGQINEIRTHDLKFCEKEAYQFYNDVMKLNLDWVAVRKIERYTEGWIAASQLTALYLKKCINKSLLIETIPKDESFITEYLLEEVYSQRKDQERDFLLATSILDRMCDSLCRSLVGKQENAISLNFLIRENLFLIPLDNEHYWYRYHYLFAKLLRAQAKKQLKDGLEKLHKKASEWFAEKGYKEEAIKHAIESKDKDWLGDLIERWSVSLLFDGEVFQLERWLSDLDQPQMTKRPMLAIVDAMCAVVLRKDIDSVELKIQNAQGILRFNKGTLSNESLLIFNCFVFFIQSLISMRRANFEISIDLANKANSILPDNFHYLEPIVTAMKGFSHFYLGNYQHAFELLEHARQHCIINGIFFVAFASAYIQAEICRLKLDGAKTLYICKTTLRLAKQKGIGNVYAIGSIHFELGSYYFDRGEYQAAKSELEHGIELQKWIGSSYQLPLACGLLAIVHMCLGDMNRAQEELLRCHKYGLNTGNYDDLARVKIVQLVFNLRNRDFSAAEKWAQEFQVATFADPILNELVKMGRIAVAIVSGPQKGVFKEIANEIQSNNKQGLQRFVLDWLILEAVAYAKNKQMKKAASCLQNAVEIGIYEGLWAHFHLCKQAIRPIIPVIESKKVRNYLSPLLKNMHSDFNDFCETTSNQEANFGTDIPYSYSKSAEKLTSREYEVLKLIAEGESNQIIASKLSVSVSTVKTHIRHIYDKLGVNSRTQAVYISRNTGLLEG